jgi:DNA invertase Pin-like site-specific DNA recombinase
MSQPTDDVSHLRRRALSCLHASAEISDVCAIIKWVEAKGASLRILGMGLDTSTASGRLMLNVLGSVAQFEREVMLAKAKGEGKYKGRKPTTRDKADAISRLAAEGLTREAIAAQLA